MSRYDCVVCGASTGEIRVALVEWAEPTAGVRYEALPRCVDVEACWHRVREQGEPWPLVPTGPLVAA